MNLGFPISKSDSEMELMNDRCHICRRDIVIDSLEVTSRNCTCRRQILMLHIT